MGEECKLMAFLIDVPKQPVMIETRFPVQEYEITDGPPKNNYCPNVIIKDREESQREMLQTIAKAQFNS